MNKRPARSSVCERRFSLSIKPGILVVLASGLLNVSTCYAAPPSGAAAEFLEPKPLPGQTLSFITYRVISIYGPGIDDSVVSIPATGTYTFEPSASADIIHWKADVRTDGKRVLKDLDGEYRDQGTSICYSGKCSFNSNASGNDKLSLTSIWPKTWLPPSPLVNT